MLAVDGLQHWEVGARVGFGAGHAHGADVGGVDHAVGGEGGEAGVSGGDELEALFLSFNQVEMAGRECGVYD